MVKRRGFVMAGQVVVHHHHHYGPLQPGSQSKAQDLALYEDELSPAQKSGIDHFPLPLGHPLTTEEQGAAPVPVVQWFLPSDGNHAPSLGSTQDDSRIEPSPSEGGWRSQDHVSRVRFVTPPGSAPVSTQREERENPVLGEESKEIGLHSSVHESWRQRACTQSADLSESKDHSSIHLHPETGRKIHARSQFVSHYLNAIGSPALCSQTCAPAHKTWHAHDSEDVTGWSPRDLPLSIDSVRGSTLGPEGWGSKETGRLVQKELARKGSFLNKKWCPLRPPGCLPTLGFEMGDRGRRTFADFRAYGAMDRFDLGSSVPSVSSSWSKTRKKVACRLCEAPLPCDCIGETSQLGSDEPTNARTMQIMREAFMLRTGSLRLAFKKMNINKTGTLSFSQFVDALLSFHVDWMKITGQSYPELFQACYRNENGEVVLNALLCDRVDSPRDMNFTQTWSDWNSYVRATEAQELRLSGSPVWEPEKRTELAVEKLMRRTREEEAYVAKMSNTMRPALLFGQRKAFKKISQVDARKLFEEEQESQKARSKVIQRVIRQCQKHKRLVTDMQSTLTKLWNPETVDTASKDDALDSQVILLAKEFYGHAKNDAKLRRRVTIASHANFEYFSADNVTLKVE